MKGPCDRTPTCTDSGCPSARKAVDSAEPCDRGPSSRFVSPCSFWALPGCRYTKSWGPRMFLRMEGRLRTGRNRLTPMLPRPTSRSNSPGLLPWKRFPGGRQLWRPPLYRPPLGRHPGSRPPNRSGSKGRFRPTSFRSPFGLKSKRTVIQPGKKFSGFVDPDSPSPTTPQNRDCDATDSLGQ